MPYTPLTPEAFKQMKPEFSDVPDNTVSQYLSLGGRFVDESWLEADYQTAWAAITCHLMTLDGLGTSSEAEIFSAVGSQKVTSIKSGTLSLTFADRLSSNEDEFSGWLDGSTCGRFYKTLLRLNRGGPRLLTGWGIRGSSGYAKDWPRPVGR